MNVPLDQCTCWLKPCFSSMTNVLYKLQGSPVKALNRVASIKNTSDWVISYSEPNPKRAVTVPAMLHKIGIPPRRRINCKVLGTTWTLKHIINNADMIQSNVLPVLPSPQSQNRVQTRSWSCFYRADTNETSQMFQNPWSSLAREAHVLSIGRSSSGDGKDISTNLSSWILLSIIHTF